MAKPSSRSRAFQDIDENSIPRLLGILEVPKKKKKELVASRSASALKADPKALQLETSPAAEEPQHQQQRDTILESSSKTPRISNLGPNRNVTTRRRDKAAYKRPPKPKPKTKPKSKPTKNHPPVHHHQPLLAQHPKRRTSLGSSILPSPVTTNAAKQRGSTGSHSSSYRRKTFLDSTGKPRLTRGSSPGFFRFPENSDRLGPVVRRLEKPNGRDCDPLSELDRMTRGRRNEGAFRSAAPMLSDKEKLSNSDHHGSIQGGDRKSTNDAKGRTTIVSIQEVGKGDGDGVIHNDNKDKDNDNSDDAMSCDSCDSFSLNSSSSSSSSPSLSSPTLPLTKPKNKSSHQQQEIVTSLSNEQDQPSSEVRHVSGVGQALPRISLQPNDAANNAPGDITMTVTANATIEDPLVFHLMMNSTKKNEMDDELLGKTVGGGQFIGYNSEHGSDLSAISSTDDHRPLATSPQNKTRSESLPTKSRTPVANASITKQASIGSAALSTNPEISILARKTPHRGPAEHTMRGDDNEEESIEAWSVKGHSSSPFFFQIDGKKYGHPALPPGWTMRISESSKQPVYTHPDHGSTWHCPIKLTPNMMYVKRNDGTIVKQKQRRNKSIEKCISKNQQRQQQQQQQQRRILSTKKSSRTARSGARAPQTPPSSRDPPPWSNKRAQSFVRSASAANSLDHAPMAEEDQGDEDSTFGLMQEISNLTVGLMQNSSSNLRKVENVKRLHQSAETPSEEDWNSGVNDRYQQQQRQQHMLVHTEDLDSEPPSTMSGLLRQNIQNSAQKMGEGHSNGERSDANKVQRYFSPNIFGSETTPSTMSDLLRQYEESARNDRKASPVVIFRGPSFDQSRKRNYPIDRTSNEMIGITGRKQLSPIEESFSPMREQMEQRDDGHQANVPKSAVAMTGNINPTTNRNTIEPGVRNHHSLIETSLPRSDLDRTNLIATTTPAGSKDLVTIPTSRKSSSKPRTFSKSVSNNRKSTLNSSQSEHIEAWFTPALGVEKTPRSTPERTQGQIHEDVAVLRFDSKRQLHRPRLHSSSHEDSQLATDTSLITEVHKSSSREKLQHSPDLYDDEWSPLAPQRAPGSEMDPGTRDFRKETSTDPLEGNFGKTVSLQRNGTSYAVNTSTKGPVIPREIHCNCQHDITTGNNQTDDAPVQATQPIGNIWNSSHNRKVDAVVPNRESNKFILPENKPDGIHGSAEKFETQNHRSDHEASPISSLSCHSEQNENNDNTNHTAEGNADTQIKAKNGVHDDAVKKTRDRSPGPFPPSDMEDQDARNEKDAHGGASKREFHKDSNLLNAVDSEMNLDVGDDNVSTGSEAVVQSPIAPPSDADELDGNTSARETENATNESAQKQLFPVAATPPREASASEYLERNDDSASVALDLKQLEDAKNKSIPDNPEILQTSSAWKLRGWKETELIDDKSASDNDQRRKNLSTSVLNPSKEKWSKDKNLISEDAMDIETDFTDPIIEEMETESANGSFALADDCSDGNESGNESTSIESLGRHREFSHNHLAPNDDISEGDRSNIEERSIQTPESGTGVGSTQESFGSSRSYATSNVSSKEDFGHCDASDADSESGSSMESPVHPTKLKQSPPQYFSPRGEDSSNALSSSPLGNDSPSSRSGEHRGMSWRVLNPPHPICSLQRLDELMREERKTKQARRRRQDKGKRPAVKRRLQTKKRGRR